MKLIDVVYGTLLGCEPCTAKLLGILTLIIVYLDVLNLPVLHSCFISLDCMQSKKALLLLLKLSLQAQGRDHKGSVRLADVIFNPVVLNVSLVFSHASLANVSERLGVGSFEGLGSRRLLTLVACLSVQNQSGSVILASDVE